ncbi:MAG: stage V sporulation protein AD [Clostridia bacterium]|nr:stage V sporulation protein AD [Clostridia bacterium]
MAVRNGKSIIFEKKIEIVSSAGCAGEMEEKGPLGTEFDRIFTGKELGKKTWEQKESELLRRTVSLAIEKSGMTAEDMDAIYSGDLLNQCTASAFGLRGFGIPFSGVYGACSTMALTLINAATAIESGGCMNAVACTCSHFCSAEKQFRMPLEYGGQRTPTAQWTVTGAGAAVLSSGTGKNNPVILAAHTGTICDLGIKDATNMGAAMAPAAKKTICDFMKDTNTVPSDFDLILTGDLGAVGSTLLRELAQKEDGIVLDGVHNDCGLMIFDMKNQDVHSGGSGCGCSASVLCSHIMKLLRRGKLKRVMFAATGALLSAVSPLQGESVPGISHAVIFEGQ